MGFRNFYRTILILACLVITGCSTTQIAIKRMAPPKFPIKGGKRLAVVDFQSPPSAPSAGSRVASSFASKLAPTRYYNMMERSRMDDIIAEHRFSQTEYVNPEHALELGRILNVDYILTGEVNAYTAEDEDIYEQEERSRIMGYYRDRHGHKRPRVKTYFVDVPVKVRRATVSASFRLINVETSEIVVGESKTATFQRRGKGTSGIASLPTRDYILTKLTDEVTGYFARLIAPYPAVDERTLVNGKTPQCKNGVKLAESGLWEKAESAWKEAVRLRPDDPAPYNNLGVAAEVRRDYEKACEFYTRALELKPDKSLFMSHLNSAKYLLKIYNRDPKE